MRKFDHHIGDYLAATAHLSDMEDLAYRRMLDLYYLRENPLVTDSISIARSIRFRSDDQIAAVEQVLREFFELRDDGWHQKRADEEIERYRKRVVSAQFNGKIGGRPKKKPNDNRIGFRTGTESKPKRKLTNHLPPTTNVSISSSPSETWIRGSSVGSSKKKHTGVSTTPSEDRPTTAWAAYACAYQSRYGVEPVRNAKVNAMLSQLLVRLGAEESPKVAAFYVGLNKQLYVNSQHCVDLLLRDCEGLRTEWATGSAMTNTRARDIDRKQTAVDAIERVAVRIGVMP